MTCCPILPVASDSVGIRSDEQYAAVLETSKRPVIYYGDGGGGLQKGTRQCLPLPNRGTTCREVCLMGSTLALGILKGRRKCFQSFQGGGGVQEKSNLSRGEGAQKVSNSRFS